jgi:peptidoglycan/LPS O-acetylase OafA/YrhL
MVTRNHALDFMRGSAAFAVVNFHAGLLWHGAPHAYIAVDLFFAISGFVLAKSYEPALRAGMMTAGDFARRRIVRLWPLWLLGVALGCVVSLAKLIAGHGNWDILTLPFALLMLPAPVAGDFMPLNVPGWSLFFELLVNALFVSVLIWLDWTWLACIAAASLAYLLHAPDLNAGNTWATFDVGTARVLFGFCCGMLAYRFQAMPKRESWMAVTAMLILTYLLYDRAPPDWITLVLLPLLVAHASTWELPRPFWGIATVMGDASYPVYVLHYPLLSPYQWLCRQYGWHGQWTVMLFIAMLMAMSPIVNRWLGRLPAAT